MPVPDPSTSDLSRILVAEDEPHIRRMLVSLLEGGGFVADQAHDGNGAMGLLAGEVPYRMALLDIMMPGMTGLEVLRKLRTVPHRTDLPVIILTAKGQDADRELAFRLGASDFVTKPFSPKKLLGRINELLDNP